MNTFIRQQDRPESEMLHILGHIRTCHEPTSCNTAAHQAMLRQVELSVGRPPALTRGRFRAKLTGRERLVTNGRPRSLERDATVQADFALTTTTDEYFICVEKYDE